MAEMKQSIKFDLKRMDQMQSNKGHSDLDSDNTCPNCGCSFGSNEDLLFRIQQLEERDKKRETEVKLLVKAVQNLYERFDNFLTHLESHLDLSSDGKIGRGEHIQSSNKSQDLTNLHAELETLANVRSANSKSKLDNMVTHESEVVQNSLPATDASNINSSSVASFAAVSSVTMETVEHTKFKNVPSSTTTSQDNKFDGRKGLSETKPSTATNLSTSVIEPKHEHSVNFSSVPNFSKGKIAKKTMNRPAETSKSISANSNIEQSTLISSDNSHWMDSETLNQIQHESDGSQETSQEVRSPVVVSDIPFKIQTSDLQKPKTDTQVSKSQPVSSTLANSLVVGIPDSSPEAKHGQKTLVSRSAGSNSDSALAAVGILKPNFTQINKKQQATSVTNTEHDDFDVNSEKKYVNLSYWKRKKLIPPQASYADSQHLKTVLCIDISASMRTNNAWEQTTQFFTEFLSEAEGENVNEEQTFAITTFGIQTKIVQTMTVDLSRLHQTFQSLKLGGPSPLYGGLHMSLNAAEPVTPVLYAGMVVYPRIILISDGHATDPTLIHGPDVVEEEKMKMIMDSACEVAKELALRKVRVYCVPVGNADMTLMEKIASVTHGRMCSFEDGALLAKFAKHNILAGKVIQCKKEMTVPENRVVTLEEAMTHPNFIYFHEDFNESGHLLQKEKEVILDLAKDALEQHLYEDALDDPHKGTDERTDMSVNEVEPDGVKYEESVNPETSLPKLGHRVRRGPDWRGGNEDGNGVGTVVGHPRDYWVNVVWDCSNSIRKYSYGAQGNFDIVIVDDPRVLKYDEVIAVGCHVQRGKDWSDGNDDGGPGSRGVVLKVQEDGRVLVRWKNKRKMYCDFGREGKFAVEICNPFDDSVSVLQLPEWATAPHSPSPFNPPQKNAGNKNKNKNKNASPT